MGNEDMIYVGLPKELLPLSIHSSRKPFYPQNGKNLFIRHNEQTQFTFTHEVSHCSVVRMAFDLYAGFFVEWQ